ncbi:Rv1355c family protein [Rhodococcus sp. IEGM 1381]|uniref:Rv1355c family protein n=1 Tax=Rhodococcus sp. IEGM 1381 TaxID=3047085 RepID=UPI0024B6E5D7|nr:Rv1355c family protein [Rhodococcus sp. IEGM 1381]MDI9894124.1 Rv1355c family protein [Rhodococcus sp. IEGM 1381]
MTEVWQPVIFDKTDAAQCAALKELEQDTSLTFLDERETQRNGLRTLLPSPEQSLLEENDRWVYFPWRKTVVAVLGPTAFRHLRLDRNRNKITRSEQDSLGDLTIGIIGLSVGHAIAHTLALEGICGTLRLADFDDIELSNLNRIPASILDLGINKAVVAARRIAEIDPYLRIEIVEDGITEDTIDGFFDGLDLLVEECDSLDVKVLAREAARSRRIPVLMETSDRGLLDVERFDLEPERPVFHGVLGEIDSTGLRGLGTRDKIPIVLDQLDAALLSARMAASMVEVSETIETWPQLGGDVQLGGATVAAAVRRFGTGAHLPSGRIRIDLETHLDALASPHPTRTEELPPADGADGSPPSSFDPDDAVLDEAVLDEAVLDAARRAPSGGNSQPWTLSTDGRTVAIGIDRSRTSTLDIGFRGSCVAVGAAAFNARVAAAAQGRFFGERITDHGVEIALGERDSGNITDRRLLDGVVGRCTNRELGTAEPLDAGVAADLVAAAASEGGRAVLLTARESISVAADVLGDADRIRYLTPHLHREMFSELRWPGDPDPNRGIEVSSLGIDDADLSKLEIVKRPDVMALVDAWDTGAALGSDMRDRVLSSSALVVIVVPGSTAEHYIRGGYATENVWVTAHLRGIAVQPVSPAFLYARTPEEHQQLSMHRGEALQELNSRFRALLDITDVESIALVLRLSCAPKNGIYSRRVPVSALGSG